ncbi:MAG: aspartate/glutamate racemase family protein [Thermoplasmatota archaeon]
MSKDCNNKYKTIGILGGMGPKATVECFNSIIESTPAEKDQDHIPIFIYNIPQIPDRTEAILYGGKNPLSLLRKSAQKLDRAGADFLIIPCNTAHYYIDEIQKSVGIPIFNMIESTIDQISEGSNVGLLATSGTIKTGIYQKYAEDKVNIITPSEEFQETVMNVIYGKKGVKAGYYNKELTKNMLKVVNHLKEKGAEYFIAGCTEIRLVLKDSDIEGASLLTPIDIIAQKSVQEALKK